MLYESVSIHVVYDTELQISCVLRYENE
jgi:hypothetical protein